VVLRGPLRGGEGRGGTEGERKGGEGKGREGQRGRGRGGEIDSDAQLEQGRQLAKAGPATVASDCDNDRQLKMAI